MTDMPQMVAIYNGMGAAAAAIAAIEFARGQAARPGDHRPGGARRPDRGGVLHRLPASPLPSCRADEKSVRLPGQNVANVVLTLAAFALGIALVILAPGRPELVLGFCRRPVLGVVVTLPIGGADMPVVISLFNAFTGLAVGFEGYVLGNPALIIAGIVVGAAGTLLTQLMAKAMNRPLANILFTPSPAARRGPPSRAA